MLTKDEYIKFALAYKQLAWHYWVLNKYQHAFINTKMEIISLMKAEILTTSHSPEIETTLEFEDVLRLVKVFKTSCAISGHQVDTELLQCFSDIGNAWIYKQESYKPLCQLACQLLRTSLVNEDVQLESLTNIYKMEQSILDHIEHNTSRHIAMALQENKYGNILSILEQIAIDNANDCNSRLNILLGVK